MGVAWLAAGLLFVATALALAAGHRAWWIWCLLAVSVSQAVILSAWSDAKFGTLVNVVLVAAAVHGFASVGPWSLRAEYEREVRMRLAPSASTRVVTDADLAPLPAPVRRYVRLAGAVGQRPVRHVRATWRGRIRALARDPWMPFVAEQHNFLDEPARFFFMEATRSGLPVDVFHRFSGREATMRVRLLSLVPLVTAAGPDLMRAETVTLLNDLCLLAPGGLIDSAIRWDAVDDRTARAHYTVGENTVSATLLFNDAGELVDFQSEDRLAQSAAGARWTRQPWSTPVGEYRRFGPWRVASRGAGHWHPPSGEFAYIELELLDLRTDSAATGVGDRR